jgi:hypothetical protein
LQAAFLLSEDNQSLDQLAAEAAASTAAEAASTAAEAAASAAVEAASVAAEAAASAAVAAASVATEAASAAAEAAASAAAAASSFLPQAARAMAAINEANRSDFFMLVSSKGSVKKLEIKETCKANAKHGCSARAFG